MIKTPNLSRRPERERARRICCGGGGRRFWTEMVAEERFSNMRMEEAIGTGAEVLVTGCPSCVASFEDSVKSMGA